MKLYHQAGHNTVWNTKSLINDSAGDGIIFSPVHSNADNIKNNTDDDLKKTSLFDPQYYVPNSQKTKLHSYDFFPEVLMDGFNTTDFYSIARESARKCLDFQLKNQFEALIIPCRFYEDLLTDFIERQKAFTVEPFLEELSYTETEKEVFISLSVTIPMLLDKKYRTSLLNWVTSYQEIDGVYLLVDYGERLKQVQDYEKLNSYVEFVEELIEAELKVICGYTNAEGLLVGTLDLEGVTMGAYENTRIFSIDKFLDNDSIKMGPAPRIYLPKLLNWIRYDTALEIKEDLPELWSEIYTPTSYSEEVFATAKKPHFTQPKLYYHHFSLLSDQYNKLAQLPHKDRIAHLTTAVQHASFLYNQLEAAGILFFDNNCKGEHLVIWNRILRRLRNSL